MFDDMEGPLPHWATGRTNGQLRIGAQLCTRDGRRTGNAVVLDMTYGALTDPPQRLFVVVTDAGTPAYLTEDEVMAMFYPPEYVMDVMSHPGVALYRERYVAAKRALDGSGPA